MFSKNKKDVNLIIVGTYKNKSISSIIYYYICRLIASNSIIFAGYVSSSRIYDYYALSDVLVVPSICEEAFGLIVLEGAACDNNIIVSNSGALPELTSPYSTICDKEYLIGNLIKALEKHYNEEYKFERNELKKKLSNYTIDKYIENYYELIK